MDFYKTNTMKNSENTDFEKGMEIQHDLGDYPDGFNPDLFDL